ncbi:MAG: RES domain-containing protein, partial [Steroidobacteraceae bacterium]
MSKFPEPPGVEALRRIAAETLELPAGTPLARIYFSAGPYPSHWNLFRHIGPTAARWDHHLPSASDEPTEQDRAVLYCAPQVDTCAAEVFQATRRIDRIRNAPALAVFALHVPVIL